MRFMMLVFPKGYETASVAASLDDVKHIAEMNTYNESLEKAGILLSLDGLHPPRAGARVSFSSGKPTVTDGPFAEAKECVGGYWMIQVKSKEEAIEWARRAPMNDNEIIEVRPVLEMEDFPAEVQAALAGLEGLQRRK